MQNIASSVLPPENRVFRTPRNTDNVVVTNPEMYKQMMRWENSLLPEMAVRSIPGSILSTSVGAESKIADKSKENDVLGSEQVTRDSSWPSQ